MAADFYSLKGVLEGVAARLGVALGFEPAGEPFLHPGRSARLLVDGTQAGWLGELHPLVCRQWDLDGAAGFEVDLAALVEGASAGEEAFEDVTTFPSVRQDLAVVVPTDVSAAQVRSAVLAGGGELLREAASSTCSKASSWTRGARASPCGSSSAPPTAPSPTRRWRPGASRSSPR